MRTSAEIRAAAWKAIREDGWVLKFLIVWMALVAVFAPVQAGWAVAVKSLGIQTWGMFFLAKWNALASGLDLVVPSRAIAVSMSEASAFRLFVTCIVNGIIAFGLFGLFLRAAKGERERWFAASFGGFRYPLDVAWLYCRCAVQILLWSLLFVVPGIVAYYRYCQCWNLKLENPDWPAGKCLAESARMMAGHKSERFSFDLSYWKPLVLLLLGLLVLVVNDVWPIPLFGEGLSFAFRVAILWGATVLSVYMAIGQAMFYLDLKASASDKRVEVGSRSRRKDG